MQQITFPFYQPHHKLNRLEQLRRGNVPDTYRGDCTVYLLHADKPIGNRKKAHGTAQHYLGVIRSTDDRRIQRRLKQHNKGNGKNASKITAAMKKKRRKLQVGMIWKGVNADFEKYLKSWKCSKEFCLCCQELPFF